MPSVWPVAFFCSHFRNLRSPTDSFSSDRHYGRSLHAWSSSTRVEVDFHPTFFSPIPSWNDISIPWEKRTREREKRIVIGVGRENSYTRTKGIIWREGDEGIERSFGKLANGRRNNAAGKWRRGSQQRPLQQLATSSTDISLFRESWSLATIAFRRFRSFYRVSRDWNWPTIRKVSEFLLLVRCVNVDPIKTRGISGTRSKREYRHVRQTRCGFQVRSNSIYLAVSDHFSEDAVRLTIMARYLGKIPNLTTSFFGYRSTRGRQRREKVVDGPAK